MMKIEGLNFPKSKRSTFEGAYGVPSEEDYLPYGRESIYERMPRAAKGVGAPSMMPYEDYIPWDDTADIGQYEDWYQPGPMEMMPFQMPEEMQAMFDYFSGYGGEPVDITAYGEARKPILARTIEDLTRQAAESAGLEGTRWSSVLAQKIGEQTGRATEEFEADLAGRWLGAQEAARARSLQGRMQAAGMAGQMAYMPMEIARGMSGLAGATQAAEMDPWELMYKQWMSQTPEGKAAAYGGLMGGALGQVPTGPPQYEEGWASKLLGLGTSLAPLIWGKSGASIFGGGGASPYRTERFIPTALPASRRIPIG